MKTQTNKQTNKQIGLPFFKILMACFILSPAVSAFSQPNYFQYAGLINTLNDYQTKTAPQMFYANFGPNGDNACFILRSEDPGLIYQGMLYSQTTLLCPTFQSGNYQINTAHTYVTADVFSKPVGVVENNGVAYVLTEIEYLPPVFVFPFKYHLTAIDLNSMSLLASVGIEIPGEVKSATIVFDETYNEIVVVANIGRNPIVSPPPAIPSIQDRPGFEVITFDPSSLSINNNARFTEDLNNFLLYHDFRIYNEFEISDISFNPIGHGSSSTFTVIGRYETTSPLAYKTFIVGFSNPTLTIVSHFWELDFNNGHPDKYQRIAYNEAIPGSELYYYTVNSDVNQSRLFFGELELFGGNFFTEFVPAVNNEPLRATTLKYNSLTDNLEIFGQAEAATGENYNKLAIIDITNPITDFFELDFGDWIDEEASDFLVNPINGDYALLSYSDALDLPKMQDLTFGCYHVSQSTYPRAAFTPTQTNIRFDRNPGLVTLHQGFTAYQDTPNRYDCGAGNMVPAEVISSVDSPSEQAINNEIEFDMIEIFDLSGKLVYTKNIIQTDRHSFNPNTLKNQLLTGIYILKFSSNHTKSSHFEKLFIGR